MTLLWELGYASSIPETALAAMVHALRKTHYLTHFPLIGRRGPAYGPCGSDLDGRRLESCCHCALGTMYQVLRRQRESMWTPSCPGSAPGSCAISSPTGHELWHGAVYTLTPGSPAASSIVGTIAPLEAVLHTRRPFTAAEAAFLDRGAACLISRALTRGSHDEEREDEQDWLKPCFPASISTTCCAVVVAAQVVRLREKSSHARQSRARAHAPRREFPNGKILKKRLSTDGIARRAGTAPLGNESPTRSFPVSAHHPAAQRGSAPAHGRVAGCARKTRQARGPRTDLGLRKIPERLDADVNGVRQLHHHGLLQRIEPLHEIRTVPSSPAVQAAVPEPGAFQM